MEEKKKTNRSFWIVFGVLLTFAAISSIGNIFEYRKMDKLNEQGKRVLCAVDSVMVKGSKYEVFVKLRVDGNEYTVTKKIKLAVHVGDSIPVYYMPDNPSVNAIAEE